MQTVILCGGKGTRLCEETDHFVDTHFPASDSELVKFKVVDLLGYRAYTESRDDTRRAVVPS